MFLINLTYKKSLNIVDEYLTRHRDFLETCYQQNALIVSGPCHPRTGGVLLSQLKNRADLEAMLKQDPFYVEGIAEYEIVEFAPVKYHADFKAFIE